MNVGSLQTASGTTASLVKAADQNPEVGTKLLKKAMDADKNLVDTLLPANGPGGGTLNIQA